MLLTTLLMLLFGLLSKPQQSQGIANKMLQIMVMGITCSVCHTQLIKTQGLDQLEIS